jgi:hypothetical protein
MSANKEHEFLSDEETKSFLPLKARWEKELVSLEEQLVILTNQKSDLTRMLASLNGILPPHEHDPAASASVSPAARPTPLVMPGPIATQGAATGKRFTPVEAYWLPTLQALTELGGKARRDEVVELVGKKMEDVLTPSDHEVLPSGVEVRWKNRVAWQRENMKRRGLLRNDSPQGTWEITETGRQWLLDTSSRLFFFTLAALRIGNLSGDQPHPVTLGGYRNFVRQYAQEFADPTLGEVADHLLTDPIVLLWKQGCMELRKYDPTKNGWWDFAELRDINLLVGRGDWTMKLTAEGRVLHAKMEEQAKLMIKKNAIGFHG